jgi:hypothetical protein
MSLVSNFHAAEAELCRIYKSFMFLLPKQHGVTSSVKSRLACFPPKLMCQLSLEILKQEVSTSSYPPFFLKGDLYYSINIIWITIVQNRAQRAG